MNEQNDVWNLRTTDTGTTPPDDGSNTTNDGKDKADAEGILNGIGNLLAGASLLVNSIDSAANQQDGSNTNTNNNFQPSPNTTSNNNNPPRVNPWLIGGAVALVLLVIGLIIYKSNGRSNKS